VATIEEAGFRTLPMHAYVPSFGEWGFVIAGGEHLAKPTTTRLDPESFRFLDDEVLHSLFEFPDDMARVDAPINRINDQQLVSIYTREWESWR
jgi:spermidine synthase